LYESCREPALKKPSGSESGRPILMDPTVSLNYPRSFYQFLPALAKREAYPYSSFTTKQAMLRISIKIRIQNRKRMEKPYLTSRQEAQMRHSALIIY
jgi:hypothetical protein